MAANNNNTQKVAAGLATTCSTLLAASQAQAMEVNQVYGDLAADNRASILLFLFAPALGWVGFNILQPFLRQVDNMNDKNSKRSVVGALGLAGLALAHTESAQAAQEVMQVAADNRASILLFLFAPALGWVGFNILQPFLRQVDNMNDKNATRR
jgi:photosystem II PsbY protein